MPSPSEQSVPSHAQPIRAIRAIPCQANPSNPCQCVPSDANPSNPCHPMPSDANPSNPCHSVPFQAEPPFQPACQPQPPTSWHEIRSLKHEKLLKLGKPLPRVMSSNTSLRAK